MIEEKLSVKKNLQEQVFTSSYNLGIAITGSPEFKNYTEARNNFVKDEEAKKLLLTYNQLVRKLNDPVYNQTNPEQLNIQVDTQKKLMYKNKILKNYFDSEAALVNLFKELNLYISRKLNFDFASFSKSQNSCCS